MKELTYFVEFDAAGESSSTVAYGVGFPNGPPTDEFFYGFNTAREHSGVELLEAWVNYDHCGYFNLKFGQFKPPTDRNFLIHESDIVLPDRTYVNDLFSLQRDVGIQIWRMSDFKFGDHDMAYDASFGIFNGEGMGAAANDSNRVGYSTRVTLFPMGYLDYVESDFACTQDPKAAFGGWYGNHNSDDYSPQYANERFTSAMRRGAWTPRWSGRAST